MMKYVISFICVNDETKGWFPHMFPLRSIDFDEGFKYL